MSWTEIEIDSSGKVTVRRGGTLTGEVEVEAGPIAEPEPKPKPKLVTWRKCVRVQPGEIDDKALWAEWHQSGHIPEDWYPLEEQSQPVETVKQLPEDQRP